MTSKIGFIGLGIMGTPMARPPDQGRARSCSCTRRSRRAAGAGRAPARTPAPAAREVAQAADVVITMVPDTPRRRGGAVRRRTASPHGLSQGQDRGRHELDLADRDQGLRAGASTRSAATTSTRRSPAARSAPRTPR
ncbi:MAG: NAD(P)-binding domain-containing protein [Comamonadaceae bacterium]|nr:NAD(P)-binding domain-containing protein [Comamonadaceae bacterium]